MKINFLFLTSLFCANAYVSAATTDHTTTTNQTQEFGSLRGSSNDPTGGEGVFELAVDKNESLAVSRRRLQPCGGGMVGNGVCADGSCCSKYGWCDCTPAHCENGQKCGGSGGTCGGGSVGDGVCADGTCCSPHGWCDCTSAHCVNGQTCGGSAPAPSPPAPSKTCGGGNVGDGVCASGACCSPFGWCDCTGAHCVNGQTCNTGSYEVDSDPITLSSSVLQEGLDVYNSFFGGTIQVDPGILSQINDATSQPINGWTLYRQLAFVAQTIWESGGYEHTREVAATTSPYTTRYDYQDCDWNTPGIQYPDNDQLFYGRGYIQLSWCANYREYGRGRMNDAEYFYKNADLVATTYPMDSASWIFENNVHDTDGNFGATTRDINGAIECSDSYTGNAPERRYQIFDALAQEVGLTGYSSAGC